MPGSPPVSASGVKLEPPNDHNGSQPLNAEDEQPAKRPRLETDGHGHGPTLSSSYRPRKRPDPIPTHMSIPSPSPTTSSSTSSNFPSSEHIVTPISSIPTSTSTSTNFQQNNHYRPTSSSSSLNTVIPPTSSFLSSWSDTKPSLPPPTPSTHALPPRPQFSLPPPNSNRVEPPPGLGAVPISSSPTNPPRNDTTVKTEPSTASTSPPSDQPSAEEIRRRADEVIARLMGTAPSASPTTPAPAPSKSEEGSIERKAEDVIARLEREARAREAAVPPAVFRPPYPPYGLPGQPPAGYYPPPGVMRPPPPPAGWRPPAGYGPPPGWRPPGPTITRFPRPPPTLPPTHMPSHLSPSNRPPFLPSAVSPITPTTAIPSPITTSAPLPTGTPSADLPILLPKKRKSESLEPPVVQPKPQNQVYIGNLPADTQLATLRKAFEALSPILTIELRAPYAMIEFEEDGAAQQAVEVYDEGSFGGVQIRVERASD
jgi:hypothetical protein